MSLLDDFESEVSRIEIRFYKAGGATALDRSLAILAEEAMEVLQAGLSVGRMPEDAAGIAIKATRRELLQLAAYAYHLAARIDRKEV